MNFTSALGGLAQAPQTQAAYLGAAQANIAALAPPPESFRVLSETIQGELADLNTNLTCISDAMFGAVPSTCEKEVAPTSVIENFKLAIRRLADINNRVRTIRDFIV